jgi:hypothetical protein
MSPRVVERPGCRSLAVGSTGRIASVCESPRPPMGAGRDIQTRSRAIPRDVPGRSQRRDARRLDSGVKRGTHAFDFGGKAHKSWISLLNA